MKRILIFILILVLGAGLLSGCTEPAKPDTEPAKPDTEPAKSDTAPVKPGTEPADTTPIESKEEETIHEGDSEMPTNYDPYTMFVFPMQGEAGMEFSPDTLIVSIKPGFDKETVKNALLRDFPLELKYDYQMAGNLLAFKTTKRLTDEALRDLAYQIWSAEGVLQVTRDAVNQLDVVTPTTALSDI